MEACIWNGHSYVAATVRAAPANPAVMSPRELTVLSVVRAARISRWRSAMSGSVADSCQVTLRAWAARIACSSRSATTPMKFPSRTTRTWPGTSRTLGSLPGTEGGSCAATECGVDELLRLAHERVQVRSTSEAFRVDLVDVLQIGRASCRERV